ncbi:hypothetical protein XENOCAPTIV_000145, partial [Xenoophorus captivus]
KGGVASGFKHVVTNDISLKRLLHVKGRRAIRATEVDMSWSSFNQGDCFIIDLGKNVYQWCGSECNRFERLKASQVAIDIRDNERNGRAKVLGPKPTIAPSTPDDDMVDSSNRKKGALYMVKKKKKQFFGIICGSDLIRNASGSMKVTVVAQSSPFKQAMLSPEECYILDNGVLPAGAETTLFKQFFSDWKDKDETTGPSKAYTIGRIAKVEQVPFDASSLHTNTIMAAQHGMVDDGKGKVQGKPMIIHSGGTSRKGGQSEPGSNRLFHIRQSSSGATRAVEVEPLASNLNTNDVFVLKSPKGLFVWRGVGASEEEMKAAKHVVDFLGGSPNNVSEGKEPGWSQTLSWHKRLVEEVPGDFTQSDLAIDDVMILDAWDQAR